MSNSALEENPLIASTESESDANAGDFQSQDSGYESMTSPHDPETAVSSQQSDPDTSESVQLNNRGNHLRNISSDGENDVATDIETEPEEEERDAKAKSQRRQQRQKRVFHPLTTHEIYIRRCKMIFKASRSRPLRVSFDLSRNTIRQISC